MSEKAKKAKKRQSGREWIIRDNGDESVVVTSVVVIADDLTGAADSAAAFARQGLKILVLWEARSLPSADVLVFTTESRHQPRLMPSGASGM